MRNNKYLLTCGIFLIILAIYYLLSYGVKFFGYNDSNNDQWTKNLNDPQKMKETDTGFTKKNKNSAIDSTFHNLHNVDSKSQGDTPVLGSIDEKIEIEIKLIDGDKGQALTNYEFEYRINEMPDDKIKKLQTNAHGKAKISITRVPSITIAVLTKDFAVCFTHLQIVYGKNECDVYLYLGSDIEIKATDQSGKIINGLKAYQIIHHLNGVVTTESIPIYFNEELNLYFAPKISFGQRELFFEASDYQYSALYLLNVLPNVQNKLGVVLTKSKNILFDLNLVVKPEFIYITRPRTLYKDSLVSYEKTEKVLKNKFGLYEYKFDMCQLTKLILTTENYLPKTVELNSSSQDLYFVSFLSDFKMKLKLINKKGGPIPDAVINYTVTNREEDNREIYNSLSDKKETASNGPFSFFIDGIKRTSISDANGDSLLSGLYLENNIVILISHKNYADYYEELWHINKEEVAEKTITLNEPNSIYGKVKFNGTNVAGANLFLVQDNFPSIRIYSSEDGSYCFKKLNEMNASSNCRLIAFHHDYGFAEISNLNTIQKDQEIEVNLKKELSLRVKVEDIDGNALSNKKVVLKARLPYLCNQWNPIIFIGMTDSNGICQIYNMPHFEFIMAMEDEFYGKNAYDIFEIPSIDNVFKIGKNTLKKINAIDFNGDPITKKIMATGYDFDGGTNIINTRFIGKEQYLEFANEKNGELLRGQPSLDKILFQLPGYADIVFGSSDDTVAMAKEFNLKFQKGFDFKVKIVSFQDEMPVSGVSVYLTPYEKGSFSNAVSNRIRHTIPTNEWGEANFTCLSGEYLLEVCDTDFSAYSYVVNVVDNDEFLISLKKGGNLKAYYTFPDNFKKAELYFGQENLPATRKIVTTVESGKGFEVFNIIPGTYDVYILLFSKYDEYVSIQLPTKIIIENNKTHEINFDDMLNSKTSLTIVALDQERKPISNALFKLFIGDKYQLDDFYKGKIFKTNERGELKLSLLPEINYYGVLESNLNHQMQIIEPLVLKSGQNKTIVAVLANARKLDKIQVIDVNGNPIEGAAFNYKDNSGKFFVPHGDVDLEMQPFTNEDGFFTDISWPQNEFTLFVTCFGFASKEITISEKQLSNQLIQIKLNYDSSIQCDFSHILSTPISVGILNDKCELLHQFILQRNYKKRLPDGNSEHEELPYYRTNVRMGSRVFSNLSAGTYYVGYFKDGTKDLIAKQGPIVLGVEENLVIKSSYESQEK